MTDWLSIVNIYCSQREVTDDQDKVRDTLHINIVAKEIKNIVGNPSV